jgi:hypothetical protein
MNIDPVYEGTVGSAKKHGRKRDQREENEIPNYRGLPIVFDLSVCID